MPTEKRSDAAPTADSSRHGKYHFLDVGAQKYGDCILVEFGTIRILIDGSHERDFEGQDGYDSTPTQLAQIFDGEEAPHPITLMVVTHCHQDHVGALPALVANEVIRPKWALITDHKLGFGRSDDDADADNRVDLADQRTQRLAAALREEDASDLTDPELEEFMDGAMTVESKYQRMLDDLKDRGVKVIEYRGQRLPTALMTALAPTGMTVLGPSQDQLVLAAEQIARTNKDASDAVRDSLIADGTLSDVQLYRGIVAREAADAAEAAGVDTEDADFDKRRGNGMNCQSITLAFGPAGARALLAGDMQFTEPGVTGINTEMASLRAAVKASGPYRLFKTTHHTSHNGQDDDLLGDLGDPPIIVHSGGSRDPSHPYPKTLKTLKSRSRDIVFARTDRNGRITVEPHRAPDDAVTISHGRLNDFTDNVADATAATRLPGAFVASAVRPERPGTATTGQVVIVNLPEGPVDMTVAGIEIVVRNPATRTNRPRFTSPRNDTGQQPRPPSSARAKPVPVDLKLAGGRRLPKLLFVTDSAKLETNIGRDETRSVLAAVRNAGSGTLLDVAGHPEVALENSRSMLRGDEAIAGIVILGGYDVVPSTVIDVLPPGLRRLLGRELIDKDGDQFFVWSDEPFGDIDGDRVAERPVSRIPDGRDPALFFTALATQAVAPDDRFGIRNVARPFAESIWSDIAGRRGLYVSKDFLSTHVAAADTGSRSQYFMLHGSDADATVFSGEDPPRYTRAFSVDNVPARFDGIVFTGCCWGALTVSQKANEIGTRRPAPRVPERSIALTYLKAGANAFVGCTGSHYPGPDTDPDANYALRFHSAFWKTLPQVDHSASLALFGARKYYGDLIGSGNVTREPLDLARRLKNRAQFTCLGLGW